MSLRMMNESHIRYAGPWFPDVLICAVIKFHANVPPFF